LLTERKNILRIILADDHTLFRHSLRVLLEQEGAEIVAEASNGFEALRLTKKENPDAVVLDMNIPLLNGIEVAREIGKLDLKTKVVMLTMFEDDASVLEAFRAGVKGYVLKTISSSELVKALGEVEQGKYYLSPGIAETVVNAYLRQDKETPGSLTCRERQVLQLVAEGNPSKEIARILNLEVKTVESHRSRLMRKLETGNIAGLVRHAVRQGLIRA
jgi:DNA-binding NarL/FixJ family response regulator